MGEHVVPAWLHLPLIGQPPYPLVIMLPGMDTFKEKLVWGYGDKMLERGFAALAIDGPGQSEALMRGLLVTADNFADAGRACLAWIDTRRDLDRDRIGVFGRSFGSYAATVFSNAIADRLRGVVVGLIHPGYVQTDMSGPSADITPEESATGVRTLAEGWTIDKTGAFYKWNGEEHAW